MAAYIGIYKGLCRNEYMVVSGRQHRPRSHKYSEVRELCRRRRALGFTILFPEMGHRATCGYKSWFLFRAL